MVRIQQVQLIPKLHHFRNRARPKESHKSQCRDEMIAKLFLTSFSICEPFLSWLDKWDYEKCRFVATDASFLSWTPIELKLNSKSKPKWCLHMSKLNIFASREPNRVKNNTVLSILLPQLIISLPHARRFTQGRQYCTSPFGHSGTVSHIFKFRSW